MKDIEVLTYTTVCSCAMESLKGRGVREDDLDVQPLDVLHSDTASSCVTCHNTRPASRFLIVTARHHLLPHTHPHTDLETRLYGSLRSCQVQVSVNVNAQVQAL